MLEEKIKQKIKLEGAISFHDFMEMALYYPEMGYYTSNSKKIGSEGDYFTSSSLNNVFGTMTGRQIEEMFQIVNEKCFDMVEYGAGTGALCFDILNYLADNKNIYKKIRYYIIEKSPSMKIIQKINLKGHKNKIIWADSIEALPEITGCFISNEVVDNFSVHKVIMKDKLNEIFVDFDNKFIERYAPADDELKEYLKRNNIDLPENVTVEISLEAESWIKKISHKLKKGFVITIDYGGAAEELYNSSKYHSTLVCYHKHTVNNDPFNNIGKQDITTDVNFSALSAAGASAGLKLCGFTNQANFLLSLGLVNYIRSIEEKKVQIPRGYQESSFFTLLIEMGKKIKVLIQQKALNYSYLSGLKFPLYL